MRALVEGDHDLVFIGPEVQLKDLAGAHRPHAPTREMLAANADELYVGSEAYSDPWVFELGALSTGTTYGRALALEPLAPPVSS